MNKYLRAGFLIAITLLFLHLLGQAARDKDLNGTTAWLPLLGFLVLIGLILNFWKVLVKWSGFGLFLLLGLTSCDFVANDEVGVRAENYGKSPEDFKIVMGKFPSDWFTRSSWNILYPGVAIPIPIDGINIASSDGVPFWCDPSLSVELIKTDEACRKYGFKFKAYDSAEEFKGALQGVLLKDVLDVMRNYVGNKLSDTINVKRVVAEVEIERQLTARLADIYGIHVVQFSMSIAPPKELEQALTQRLVMQETAKTTMAKLDDMKAQTMLAAEQQKKMAIESQAWTPELLLKYRSELAYNAWIALANSPNKAFVGNTPLTFMGDK